MKHITCVRRTGSLLTVLLAALLLVGCARTAPISYYQLVSLETGRQAQATGEAGRMRIGIGPVRLPEYLDRPQLVTRLSVNRLQLADSRWVEPLSENIPRVLGETLSALLGTERILRHPWPSSITADYQLLVEVLHFENESDGAARLVARWSVKDKDGGIVLPERRSSYLVAAAAQDQEGRVAALNEALRNFCREIAQGFKGFSGK